MSTGINQVTAFKLRLMMDFRVVVRNRSIQLKIFTAKTPSSQRVHREKQGFPGISLGNSLLPLRELGVLAVKFFDLVHHPGIHHEPKLNGRLFRGSGRLLQRSSANSLLNGDLRRNTRSASPAT
jgi:hypothetical protein